MKNKQNNKEGNNKEGKAIMKSLLTINKEGLKKAIFLLELQGLIENKTVFELEQVLKTTRKNKEIKVYNNLYTIEGKV